MSWDDDWRDRTPKFLKVKERTAYDCFIKVRSGKGESAVVWHVQFPRIEVPFERLDTGIPAIQILFPEIRAVRPRLMAQDIIDVQPMTAPSGLVFWLDYSFREEK